MPSFTSKTDRSSEAGFVFRSELPVQSLLEMVPFVPQALKIRRSLDQNMAADGGLLAYDLVADLGSKRFTVYSAWTNEQSFAAWTRSPEHVRAMKKLGPVQGATFDTETITKDA